MTQAGWQTRERLGGAVAEEYKQESLGQQSRIFQVYTILLQPCAIMLCDIFACISIYFPFSVKFTDSESEELVGSVLFVNLNIKKCPRPDYIYISLK